MIIKKYFNNYETEDLYQIGVIGVIKAYNNYKNDKNTKFSTYAYKYIYGEIYSYINNSKIIKVAKENIKLYKKINEAKNILSQKLMKEPSTYELSRFLEIEPIIIENVINSMKNIESLDKTINNEENDISLIDTVKDKKDYYNIDYISINEEINNLPSPDKELMLLRYYEDKTQSEVAKILGLNQVEVSRKEKKTLKRIKEKYQHIA